jgi:hypothetical protein
VTSQQTSPTRASDEHRDRPVMDARTRTLVDETTPRAATGRSVATVLEATGHRALIAPLGSGTVRRPAIGRSDRTGRHGVATVRRPATARSGRTDPLGNRIVLPPVIGRSVPTVPRGAGTARRPVTVRSVPIGLLGSVIARHRVTDRSVPIVPHEAATVLHPATDRIAGTARIAGTRPIVVAVPTADATAARGPAAASCGRATVRRLGATATRSGKSVS